MKRGRLVIARYNEDTSWVNRASEFQTDVVIYDKGDNIEDPVISIASLMNLLCCLT